MLPREDVIETTEAPLSLRSDSVTESTHGFDERRADFPSQPGDEDLDGVRVAFEVLRVDVLREFALRNQAPSVMHKVGENAELVASESDWNAVHCHLRCSRIEHHRTAAQRR